MKNQMLKLYHFIRGNDVSTSNKAANLKLVRNFQKPKVAVGQIASEAGKKKEKN